MSNQIHPYTGDFLTELKNDIHQWLESDGCGKDSSIFSCEADFQQRLCRHISSLGKYGEVIPEFKLPFGLVEDIFKHNGYTIPSIIFPWSNDLNLDIVVKDKVSDKFAIIELKYATKEILTDSFFGEKFNKEYSYLKNQGASNLIMYNYWKDVRRIEMVCRNFKNVVGGLAILVTNSGIYLQAPNDSNATYKQFSTYEGREVGKLNESTFLEWSRSKRVESNHPNFIIEGTYKCEWYLSCFNYSSESNGVFHFLINEIRAPKNTAWKPYFIFIDKKTTVSQLTEKFYKDFGLKLKVKKRNMIVSPETVLINEGAKLGKIEFRTSITVDRLIKKIKDKLNIEVSIFTKDENVKVLPDITISNAGQIPAGATKATMERFRSYKRKKKD